MIGSLTTLMVKYFKRDIQTLESVFAFIDDFRTAHPMSDARTFAVKFSVEEVFTNMVKYNPTGTRDIAIDLRSSNGTLTVQLIDQQQIPFDPTLTPSVDLMQPLEQRNPGGLGIHLTKEMADGFTYEHTNNESKVTLTFRLEH